MYEFDNIACKQFTEHYKKHFLLQENELYRLKEIKNKERRGI
jgi:hypothetical protein